MKTSSYKRRGWFLLFYHTKDWDKTPTCEHLPERFIAKVGPLDDPSMHTIVWPPQWSGTVVDGRHLNDVQPVNTWKPAWFCVKYSSFKVALTNLPSTKH